MNKLLPLSFLALALAACGVAQATGNDETTTTTGTHKVFVCKYVGTPGEDERLQTGDNPISVDVDSLKNFVGIGSFFNDAQGRSVAIAFDTGQPEPSVGDCPTPSGGTTTTKKEYPSTTTQHPTTTERATTTTERATTTSSGATTTTRASTTTTTTGGTTTTTTGGSTTTSSSVPGGTTTTSRPPTPGLFSITVEPTCPDGTEPEIDITFGNRPDLDGQIGTLTFSTGGSIQLEFNANNTVPIQYPDSAGTGPVTMTYTLGTESVTRSTTFPEACTAATTTTGLGGSTTTTTAPGGTTTTTLPGTPPLPSQFSFGAAATVCVREVPTITINFQNLFPQLAGQTGTLTMEDINGNVVSQQPLVYAPGTSVNLLYPGTRVNADGSIADVPGWNLNADGFWVRDPSDAYLREGINLTYTVNPTATAFVTYPPESANCANPDGPFPPTVANPPAPGVPFAIPPSGFPPPFITPPSGLPPTL